MLSLAEYDYELPRELIAQHPLAHRTDARLLVVDRSTATLQHHHIRDLPGVLREHDTLVINDTRVIPARLVGFRVQTGGRWEGLFLSADDEGNWRLLAKTRGKLLPGERVMLVDEAHREVFRLRLVLKQDDGSWIARPELARDALRLLEQVGRVPLPPYIRSGEMQALDRQRYQTVYADVPGSIAAPTAGLHFTGELLTQLESCGVRVVRVTLHVGLDTFRPVADENLTKHRMHSEWCRITPEAVATIAKNKSRGGRTIAVGTTTVRVLETAARDGALAPFEGPSDLFIHPPYEFRAVDCLLTNFHLPRTTLLVLVRTFGGDALIKRAYQQAIEEEYRFFSYGDAMLIV